jgi:hypothetical protein
MRRRPLPRPAACGAGDLEDPSRLGCEASLRLQDLAGQRRTDSSPTSPPTPGSKRGDSSPPPLPSPYNTQRRHAPRKGGGALANSSWAARSRLEPPGFSSTVLVLVERPVAVADSIRKLAVETGSLEAPGSASVLVRRSLVGMQVPLPALDARRSRSPAGSPNAQVCKCLAGNAL